MQPLRKARGPPQSHTPLYHTPPLNQPPQPPPLFKARLRRPPPALSTTLFSAMDPMGYAFRGPYHVCCGIQHLRNVPSCSDDRDIMLPPCARMSGNLVRKEPLGRRVGFLAPSWLSGISFERSYRPSIEAFRREPSRLQAGAGSSPTLMSITGASLPLKAAFCSSTRISICACGIRCGVPLPGRRR